MDINKKVIIISAATIVVAVALYFIIGGNIDRKLTEESFKIPIVVELDDTEYGVIIEEEDVSDLQSIVDNTEENLTWENDPTFNDGY